jgi:hypothetical protein
LKILGGFGLSLDLFWVERSERDVRKELNQTLGDLTMARKLARTRSQLSRTPRLESLETRQLMAADFSGGILSLSGSTANDQMELFSRGLGIVEVNGVPGVANGTRYSGVNELRIDSSTGDDTIKLDGIGRRITIQSSTGNDQVEVIHRDSSGATSVTVDGNTGDDSIVLKSETTRSGNGTLSFNLMGSTGNDRIQVDYVSESATAVMRGTIDASTGNDEVSIQVDFKPGTTNAVSDVKVDLSTGDDKLSHMLQSDGTGLTRVALDTRDATGMSEINSLVDLDATLSRGDVVWNFAGSTGMDKVEADLLSQVRDRLSYRTTMNLGGDNDVAGVKVSALSNAAVDAFYSVDMGSGNDEFLTNLATFAAVNLSGSIRAGSGFDKLSMEFGGSTRTNLVVDAGSDSDVVEMIFKGSLTANRLEIYGGDGDDKIALLAESLSGTPLIDAGTGFDEVKGLGRIINAEIIA